MARNTNKPNPKGLKLEGLEKIKKKVTVGFKCYPSLKLQLAMEAKRVGLTLSEFLETYIQQTATSLELEEKNTAIAKQRLAFYENDILLGMFKKYEKQEIKFTTARGENTTVVIKEPKDIYTVMINSYKLKK